MPLHEADAVFGALDSSKRFEREQPDHAGNWYDKTKFRIDFSFQGQPDNYEGRQDFGDGDGSLIEHIRGYHEYYAQDESWKNHVLHHDGPEAWEADKAQRENIELARGERKNSRHPAATEWRAEENRCDRWTVRPYGQDNCGKNPG